jgi:phasin family protein
MNDHFSPNTEAIPNGMFLIASPEAFATAAKEGAKIMEELMLSTQSLGQKAIEHTASTTRAVFDAAQAIAKAKTIPDALRVQTEFTQKQFSTAIEQGQEFFAMSTKIAQDTLQILTNAMSKATSNGS